jgi:nicotinamide riboside kinase
MIRRISIFGGPGCGKSIAAAKVFVDLKIKGYSIELCREFVKEWAYQKKSPQSFDQYYIFGKQLHAEDVLLSNGVKYIVTDSPLLMQLVYMSRDFDVKPNIPIIKEFDKKYPALNIFLSREGIQYQQHGRWEDVEQAIDLDNQILEFLKSTQTDFHIIKSTDFDTLIQTIENSLV